MTHRKTDTTTDRSTERLLTIEPIVGWRRWIVTARRQWEGGVGEVLRGAWGRPWNGTKLTAECFKPPTRADLMVGKLLHNMKTGRHSTPSPAPDCTCGIYTEKVDTVAPTFTPRLEGRPTVGGFVELSGIVIEGTRGYRAGRAQITGPLELHIPCGGEMGSTGSEPCLRSPTVIVTQGGDPVGKCEAHMPADLDGVPVGNWVDQVVPRLEATYSTPIFHIAKGGTHGHW